MEEIIRQALAIVRGMWRFRWPGVIVAWLTAVIGTVYVMQIPDVFAAAARIYVDTQSILKPLMAGLTVQPNVDQQIGMLSRTLISRPNLEKLVRMADLDLKASTPAQQDAVIDRLAGNIRILSSGRDNLYSLEYRDSDKDKAKRVVQSLVSIFVESGLGSNRKDTDAAKSFITDQIKQYEAKLEEAEARVKEFRLRNLERQPLDGKDAMSRVIEANAQLQQAQLELHEAENARKEAKAQLDAERSSPGGSLSVTQSLLQESAVSVATPEIDARIEGQKRNLDTLQQRYTDQHPDVVAAKRQIKELEDQKRKEVAELRKLALANPSTAPAGTASVAAQELGRMLASAEVRVASLRARADEYAKRLGEARSGLKTAPQLEAEAAQLNRDYEITKKNYNDLVSRRQQAVMSGELEVASGVADFRLIDPPRVSPQPVAPNRLAMLPMALLAALAAGLGVSFAASQLWPVYSDGEELRAGTGLPLLGVVSLVINEVDRRRERVGTMWFFGASGGLVGMFALGMVAMALLARRAV